MGVTTEQNIALRSSIRNDLRYITPGVPERYAYKRGPWSPVTAKPIKFVDADGADEEEKEPVITPAEVTEYAEIDIATAALHTIIAGAVGRRIRIWFLTFTVGGEVNVTLYDGAGTISGPMDFGGANEPRGVVMGKDGKALLLDDSNAFGILLSAAVQVSGFCIYSYG